ncbi:MAG TPA: esterase, partial [Streptomyces sp.]|nr:esterase [Streptomyces sp.]
PLPAVYSIHGGGFVVGSPEADHDWNLRLCREARALVVSVDYRLAPEHRFPAGLEDCYAGLCWLAENAAALGVAADRVALWGDSARA